MKGWRVSCIIPPMAQRNRYRETTGAHTWGCRAAVGMLAGSFLAAAAGGCAPGYVKAADLESAIGPHTRMVVLNHASNVVGSVLPVSEAGAIARRHDVLLLVDSAQTAGAYPIDI